MLCSHVRARIDFCVFFLVCVCVPEEPGDAGGAHDPGAEDDASLHSSAGADALQQAARVQGGGRGAARAIPVLGRPAHDPGEPHPRFPRLLGRVDSVNQNLRIGRGGVLVFLCSFLIWPVGSEHALSWVCVFSSICSVVACQQFSYFTRRFFRRRSPSSAVVQGRTRLWTKFGPCPSVLRVPSRKARSGVRTYCANLCAKYNSSVSCDVGGVHHGGNGTLGMVCKLAMRARWKLFVCRHVLQKHPNLQAVDSLA